MSNHHTTESMYAERTGTLSLHGTPDEVFPLFGPGREREWAHDWAPEAIYPSHIAAIPGSVFRTYHGGEAIWVMNAYDEDARIVSYTNFRTGDRVTQIRVAVEPDPLHEARSLAHIRYAIVALSELGTRYIAHFNDAHYAAMMREWENEINVLLQSWRQY